MIPRIIYLAVFLSGFASLGYELCWIRKGALLIGASPQALSLVVAVFFGGMATGAALFGYYSKRASNPLLCYGILECAIGVMAALTPALFETSRDISAVASQWAGTSQPLQLLARSAVVSLLIFPACFLIGGTLPLLCQYFINNRQADIRNAAGILYAINTAGAFFGCMLCGMYFIPYLGTNTAVCFAACLNIAVGLSVIWLSKVTQILSSADVPPATSTPCSVIDSKLTGFLIYGLFFGSGFVALGYEILWVRFLSLIIHNTVYTCIFSIGAILLGIALGGWLVTRIKERPGQDVLLFGLANIFISVTVHGILMLPVAAWNWIVNSRSVAMQALFCITVILIPSVASGISFPLAYRMIAAERNNSGRDFGILTAVNTIGGITGSLLVGFYLLPSLGMNASLTILTSISLVVGAYSIFAFAETVTVSRRVLISVGAIMLWFLIPFVSNTRLPRDFLAAGRTMYEFSEGISSFVAVVKRDGIKTLEIDRLWQGQNPKGHQILAAHIPMLLHQNPKEVLVIGMGTGQTASRFLFYDIQRLDTVDIEGTLPGMLRRHFDAAWLSDKRSRAVTDDGHNFIAKTKMNYDIISVEVGQAFRPQIASFYTVEFYREVKKRLNKNGLACQFVPVGFFMKDEFLGVVRTFLEVFPHSTLWLNKYGELLLVGNQSEQPRLSEKRVALLQSDERLRADLDYSFDDIPPYTMNRPNVFAANFLMAGDNLARLTAGAQLYNDDQPTLEYKTARTLYALGRTHDLIEQNMESPDNVFARKITAATRAEIIKIRAKNVHEILAGEK